MTRASPVTTLFVDKGGVLPTNEWQRPVLWRYLLHALGAKR